MTQVTIETINGNPCTIIRRPFDAEWVREQLAMGVPVLIESAIHRAIPLRVIERYVDESRMFRGSDTSLLKTEISATVTILPALPRKPRAEHAKLLHRYYSEGLTVYHEWTMTEQRDGSKHRLSSVLVPEQTLADGDYVTHCVTEQGERVSVAITEEG